MKKLLKYLFWGILILPVIYLIMVISGVFAYSKIHGEAIDAFIKPDITKIQSGDIIFQTSQSNQSKAIQLATNSVYSHMGIIYENNGKYWVYEAVQPVKLTPLPQWISRGLKGHYVIKRLKNAAEILTPEVLISMKHLREKYNGKPYDIYFEWSDEKIYCSELVWKIYQEATEIEIGELERLSDFDLTHPIVQSTVQERYSDNIPFDEKVISPAAMFHSDKLVTVESN